MKELIRFTMKRIEENLVRIKADRRCGCIKSTPRACTRGVALRIQLCRVSWDKEPSPVPVPEIR